jgi:hypothetical protein
MPSALLEEIDVERESLRARAQVPVHERVRLDSRPRDVAAEVREVGARAGSDLDDAAAKLTEELHLVALHGGLVWAVAARVGSGEQAFHETAPAIGALLQNHRRTRPENRKSLGIVVDQGHVVLLDGVGAPRTVPRATRALGVNCATCHAAFLVHSVGARCPRSR